MWAQEVVMASPVKSMIIRRGGAEKPLVLYQPKGLSLPDNEEFELLLKALSIRLARKDLVTTVIQCSELNVEERRMDVGGDLMLDGGVRSADQGTLIPLYTVARPLAWCKDPPHPERRQEFKNIREHFYALTNLVFAPINRSAKIQFICAFLLFTASPYRNGSSSQFFA
ncbi:hypothetical protein F5141DRAFT_613966 [Pisolithus sp. B1]|nr:hypothetical protein F5141DRAFT_613966 [Pisolithus sp. B1]